MKNKTRAALAQPILDLNPDEEMRAAFAMFAACLEVAVLNDVQRRIDSMRLEVPHGSRDHQEGFKAGMRAALDDIDATINRLKDPA